MPLYELARDAAERAIRIDDQESIAWSALGWTLFQTWHFPEAEAAFERGRRLSPTSWNLALGHFYRFAGNHDAAVEALEQALVRDPGSVIVRRDLGETLACAGRFDEALPRLDPDGYPDALGAPFVTARARVRLRQGRYREAIRDFESYTARHVQGAEPPSLMTYAYSRNGDREKAQEIVAAREAAGVRNLADDLAVGDTLRLLRRLRTLVDDRDRILLGMRCWEIRDDLLAIPDTRAMIAELGLPN